MRTTIHMLPIIAVWAAALFGSACSSKLVVRDDGKALPGLPVRSEAPYVEIYALHAHSKGAVCAPALKYRHVYLPEDRIYYLDVEPKPFAKSALTVKYTERGTVNEVAFNTEPSADAVEATTTMASTLLPFLGVAKVGASEQSLGAAKSGGSASKERGLVPDQTTTRLACDTGELPLALWPRKEVEQSGELARRSLALLKELQTPNGRSLEP